MFNEFNISIPGKRKIHLKSIVKKFKHRFCIKKLLIKIPDLDKYKYSGYDIGFVSCSVFSFTDGGIGKSSFLLGADMTLSVHIDNKRKKS